MIPPLETQQTGDQDLELSQQNLKRFAKVLEDNPLLDGHLIEDQDLALGVDTPISHRLGRQPRGWILARIRGGAGAPWIREISSDPLTLTLHSNTAINVSLWVY